MNPRHLFLLIVILAACNCYADEVMLAVGLLALIQLLGSSYGR